MEGFGDRLAGALMRVGNPVVVGLDPRWDELPDSLKSGVDGSDSAQRATVYWRFCREIIDVIANRVAVVKPQVAFFEQLGPAGMQALAETIAHAHGRGLLVIADGKRNDIGSTAEAYADGWLGAGSTWQADALTISPYLGDDSLTPFVSTATSRGAGLFVLAKTSNPGGGQFQDLPIDGRTVYRRVADHVESLAGAGAGASGYGAVGAVVGATYPGQLAELRAAMPHAWILVPGYGSQGGTARDVAPSLRRARAGRRDQQLARHHLRASPPRIRRPLSGLAMAKRRGPSHRRHDGQLAGRDERRSAKNVTTSGRRALTK